VSQLKNRDPRPISNDQPKPVEGAAVVSRLANHPRLKSVAGKFAQQMPGRIDAIVQAWHAGDLDALAQLAHWLKGSGGTAGFDAFTAPAKALEELTKRKDLEQMGPVIEELRALTERMVDPSDMRSTA
jgi:HPt (histidine-containing phosphotransfer) domain-containing protein